MTLSPNDFPFIQDYLSKFKTLRILCIQWKIDIPKDRCIYVILYVSVGSHSWIACRSRARSLSVFMSRLDKWAIKWVEAQGDITLTWGLDLVRKEQRRSGILTSATGSIKRWAGGRLSKKGEQQLWATGLQRFVGEKLWTRDPPGSELQETKEKTWLDPPIPSHSALRKSQEPIRDSVTITVIHYNIIL